TSGCGFCLVLLTTKTGRTRKPLSPVIRSGTQWINTIRGTRRRFPNRKNATLLINTPGSCRHDGMISAQMIIWLWIQAAGRSRASGQLQWLTLDIGYVKATGNSVKIVLPQTAMKPEVEFEWKIPKWSNAIERDRARTYFQAYAAAAALYFVERAMAELHAGRTQTFTPFTVPEEAIG